MAVKKRTLRQGQGRNRGRMKSAFALYSMMIPGLVYLFINNYLSISGLILAFKKFDYSKGIWKSDWVGLKNFKFLFQTRDAWLITRNTLGYNFVFIFLGTVLAVTVAILLNSVRNMWAKKTYQTLILIPYLISMVVVSYIVFAFLSQENGLLNSLLVSLGKNKTSWYSSPKYWPYILVLVNLWKGFGYNSIIYFATVIGIDTSLYEAAVVDGAGKWAQIWHITLPGLRSTIVTMVLLNIGRVFYSDFGLFYQVPMNAGPLADVTTTIDVYKGLTLTNDIGRAAAAGFYQSICGFILVMCANLIVRRIDKDNALF